MTIEHPAQPPAPNRARAVPSARRLAAAALASMLLLSPFAAAQSASTNLLLPQRHVIASIPNQVQMTAVEATIDIVEQVATTSLTIRLHNPTATPQEAQLILPVPAGATIRTFGYDGDGLEPTAKILPADEARRIYEDIVRQRKDPALLEFVGHSLVQSSVFPVPPGKTQNVWLVYEHLTPRDGSRFDYVLPRSEALDASIPWTISGRIRSAAPITTLYSPSHPVVVERLSPGELKFQLGGTEPAAPGSLRLSALTQHDALSATLLAYPDTEIGGGYFLLLAGLPADLSDEALESIRREVTIVIDRSGSMKGEKIQQARDAAAQVLKGLRPIDTFRIIDYSDTIGMFHAGPLPADEPRLRDALDYVARIQAEGGTNIHDALLEAVRPEPAAGALPVVLFLTDGMPTVGVTREADIRRAVENSNTHDRRIFTFGVGFDVNAPLLDRIAGVSRGAPTIVDPGENVEVKISQVSRRLSGPVLTDPVLTALDAQGNPDATAVRELEPAQLRDLFKGDQVVVLGRFRGENPLRFRIAGSFLGEPRTFEFTFPLASASTQNAFVPRLWATRRVATLIDAVRQLGAEGVGANDPRARELINEVVALSTRFGILTEYTAFLSREDTNLADTRQNREELELNLENRAMAARSGAAGAAQSKNIQRDIVAMYSVAGGRFLDDEMNVVTIDTVQNAADQTLVRRGERWVDMRIASAETDAKPDRVVKFGSDEYFELARELAAQGRVSILAQGREVFFEVNGQRVLVQAD